MKKNKYEIDMCNGTIMDKLISFSLPLMVSGILQLMFHKIAADPVNPGASDDDKAVQKLCQDFLSGLF